MQGKYYYGLGRRKNAIARVYIEKGKGNISVNNKEWKDYFTVESLRNFISLPLKLKEVQETLDIKAFVKGGGISGQAGAMHLGIARALLELHPEWRTDLKKKGFLTRDSRKVERKKYGQKGARAKFQYSKR